MTDKLEIKRVGSLSTKSIGFTAKAIRAMVDETKGELVFLARIGGVVAEMFTGNSKHGEWTGFRGMFTLVNKDGEAYSSTIAFLPGNITKGLAEQINHGVAEVGFTVDIYAQETDKNASGYAYVCEPVMSEDAIKKSDTIASRVLALPLPGKGSSQKKLAIAGSKK